MEWWTKRRTCRFPAKNHSDTRKKTHRVSRARDAWNSNFIWIEISIEWKNNSTINQNVAKSLHFKSISILYFRKVSGKKPKDSITDRDYCSICHKSSAAGTSNEIKNAANEPLLLTTCGHCSASICKSPTCAIWSANRDCWECNDCGQQQVDTSTGYLQAYDWIFERLNRKFSERASAIAREKSEVEQRRCCSNVMLDSNGNSIWLWCLFNSRSTIVPFSVSGEPVLVPPPLQERIRVREFIEDLISSMLGGSLDDVCVGQIYENIDCEYWRRGCLHSRRFSIYFRWKSFQTSVCLLLSIHF